MISGIVISSVIRNTPRAVLSLYVFTAHVKTIALANSAKLMAAVSSDLFSTTTCRKYNKGLELAFQK